MRRDRGGSRGEVRKEGYCDRIPGARRRGGGRRRWRRGWRRQSGLKEPRIDYSIHRLGGSAWLENCGRAETEGGRQDRTYARDGAVVCEEQNRQDGVKTKVLCCSRGKGQRLQRHQAPDPFMASRPPAGHSHVPTGCPGSARLMFDILPHGTRATEPRSDSLVTCHRHRHLHLHVINACQHLGARSLPSSLGSAPLL